MLECIDAGVKNESAVATHSRNWSQVWLFSTLRCDVLRVCYRFHFRGVDRIIVKEPRKRASRFGTSGARHSLRLPTAPVVPDARLIGDGGPRITQVSIAVTSLHLLPEEMGLAFPANLVAAVGF